MRVTSARILCLLAAVLIAASGCTGRSGSSELESPATSTASHSRVHIINATMGKRVLAGDLLLVGPTDGTSNVYRVGSDGSLDPLTSLRGMDIGVSSVTSNGRAIVVDDDRGSALDHLETLHDGKLTDLGLGHGFAPALSRSGQLAWIELRYPPNKPDAYKPDRFVVMVRKNSTTPARQVFVSRVPAASPVWINRTNLLVAAGDTKSTDIYQITIARHPQVIRLDSVPTKSALALTASARWYTLEETHQAVVSSINDHVRQALPPGWLPLCWRSPSDLLAAKNGTVATVHIESGRQMHLLALAHVPSMNGVYGAVCLNNARK